MAELRRVLPASFASLVTAEITKDLTNHSVTAITELLQAEEPLF
jgi:protein required for attachment to host cells